MVRMSKQEQLEWDDLYQYVKKEVLRYDDAQSLPQILVLSLKGMKTGKCIENKKIEDKANYSYNVIKTAFIINKAKIDNVLSKIDFKSERSKFTYICKIVESDLNDCYLRAKRVERDSKEIKTVVLPDKPKQNYTKQSKEIKNQRLKDLW